MLPVTVSAEDFNYETINSYTYDYWGKGVVSPDCYKIEKITDASQTTSFKEPSDLFIDDNGEVYVADTGNNRIVVLNSDLTYKKEYKTFKNKGKTETLSGPSGVFVDKNGCILIADTQNHRVLKSDNNGNIIRFFSKPDKSFNFTGIDYLPTKIIEDSNDCVYVLCNGIFQGAMMYEGNGDFIGYYGANNVEITLSVIVETFWHKFMTKAQREKSVKFVPLEFDNMFLDEDGFIYTVTSSSSASKNQIKKLNPKGDNVLKDSSSISAEYAGVYGDLKAVIYNGKKYETEFVDVTVDKSGFISAVDMQRGRIFQYDSEGNMMVAFCSIGTQNNTFGLPSAIENYNDRLFVLDSKKNNIVVFSLTDYGQILHNAILEYNDGNFSKSEGLWKQVLKSNDNYNLAYTGIGKIYHEKKDYKNAMKYFKLSGDRINFANSFKQYRNIILRNTVFPLIAILILLAVVFYIGKKIYIKIKKSRNKGVKL